jgi:hypothetical protein
MRLPRAKAAAGKAEDQVEEAFGARIRPLRLAGSLAGAGAVAQLSSKCISLN